MGVMFALSMYFLTSHSTVKAASWKGQWIWSEGGSEANTWSMFRKDIELEEAPSSAKFYIAADTKYWMWINDQLVIYEGGLKRGPKPEATYIDYEEISPYLQQGNNTLSILVWYFGKEGFAHKNSGQGGLYFQGQIGTQLIVSDETWKAKKAEAYRPEQSGSEVPNFRLAESNVIYDARREIPNWYGSSFDDSQWSNAVLKGTPPSQPWGQLVERPIPQWKDYGLKDYEDLSIQLPYTTSSTTIVYATLPYNAQVSPYFKAESGNGKVIDMRMDNYNGGNAKNVKAVYTTKQGEQSYESLGWMNGHKVIYTFPPGVMIKELKYRETGYDTALIQGFSSNDPFYNKLVEKAKRTLYVTMRDNYMDCPDRERAQWWGDAVIELGETFYTMDRKADLLTKKAILELAHWQKNNKVLYSPVPSGNWGKELPGQMLASIGKYGFWYYYMYTGDKETIAEVYPSVKRYLSLWTLDGDGLVNHRNGGWNWGDWGQHIDRRVIDNALYYMALDGAKMMAEALDIPEDQQHFENIMNSIKNNFNPVLWNGTEYRSPGYTGDTDDRGHGLAVVAGLAEPSQYEAIRTILQQHRNASPYMEKYVLEALYIMDMDVEAMGRMKNRYSSMVNDESCSTLWELWSKGGGSTYNHAWTGGPLTLLGQYGAGVAPLEPGFSKYSILPQMGNFTQLQATIPSIKGDINVTINRKDTHFTMEVECPAGGEAIIGIPKKAFSLSKRSLDTISVDNQVIWNGTDVLNSIQGLTFVEETNRFVKYIAEPGHYSFVATPGAIIVEPITEWVNLAEGNGVTASSSYENGGWSSTNLTDGKEVSTEGNKGYSSISNIRNNHQEWIQVDLGAKKEFGQLILYPRSDGDKLGEGFPVDFDILVSEDGTSWTTVQEQRNYPKPESHKGESFTFDTVEGRYVRILAENLRYNVGEQAYFLQFSEMEIYKYKELLREGFDENLNRWTNTNNTTLSNSQLEIWNNEKMTTIAGEDWTNYSMIAHVNIEKGALGLVFRKTDDGNFYMWQLSESGKLRPHKKVNNQWTVIKEVEASLEVGKEYRVQIDIVNDHIYTYINGALIDKTVEPTFKTGKVGLRQYGSEKGQIKDLVVVTKE